MKRLFGPPVAVVAFAAVVLALVAAPASAHARALRSVTTGNLTVEVSCDPATGFVVTWRLQNLLPQGGTLTNTLFTGGGSQEVVAGEPHIHEGAEIGGNSENIARVRFPIEAAGTEVGLRVNIDYPGEFETAELSGTATLTDCRTTTTTAAPNPDLPTVSIETLCTGELAVTVHNPRESDVTIRLRAVNYPDDILLTVDAGETGREVVPAPGPDGVFVALIEGDTVTPLLRRIPPPAPPCSTTQAAPSLPVTGASAGGLAAVALTLIAGGALLVVFAMRRRRDRTTEGSA